MRNKNSRKRKVFPSFSHSSGSRNFRVKIFEDSSKSKPELNERTSVLMIKYSWMVTSTEAEVQSIIWENLYLANVFHMRILALSPCLSMRVASQSAQIWCLAGLIITISIVVGARPQLLHARDKSSSLHSRFIHNC